MTALGFENLGALVFGCSIDAQRASSVGGFGGLLKTSAVAKYDAQLLPYPSVPRCHGDRLAEAQLGEVKVGDTPRLGCEVAEGLGNELRITASFLKTGQIPQIPLRGRVVVPFEQPHDGGNVLLHALEHFVASCSTRTGFVVVIAIIVPVIETSRLHVGGRRHRRHPFQQSLKNRSGMATKRRGGAPRILHQPRCERRAPPLGCLQESAHPTCCRQPGPRLC